MTQWNKLTDEDRERALKSMPDMLEGFMKSWGWLHFAKAIEEICREKNEAPAPDVQPVAWSVFDKRRQKHWYTNESIDTANYYAKEYSHREADGSPSMLVVPLYTHPLVAPDVQEEESEESGGKGENS